MERGSPYANNGTDPAASFAQRAGDHHDGMQFFGLSTGGGYSASSSDRGLLCMNHEAITSLFLHPNGQTLPAGPAPSPRRWIASSTCMASR